MLSLAPSNAALVRQVLHGRRDRFDVLVRRHLRAVHAVAFAVTSNYADAEDVMQDAFLKAYTSLDTLREPAKFEGWLMKITRNSALKAIEKRGREKRRAEHANDLETHDSVDQAREELYNLLGEKMKELDNAHREVLTLYYFAGKRTREIASILDVSQAAVLKRLQRARSALGGELLKEVVGSRSEKEWIATRSKEIAKLVLAASVGWTATGTSGALALGSILLSGRAFVIGAIGIGGIATVVGVATLRDSRAPSEPVGPVVTASAEARGSQTEAPAGLRESEEMAAEAKDSPARDLEEDMMEAIDPVPVASVAEPEPNSGVDFAAILQSPVGIVFEDLPLCDVVDFIGSTYNLPILIDVGAVYVPDEKRASEDAQNIDARRRANADREYYTDGMFESIQFDDLTLVEILDEFCGALGLAYVSEPAYIWISTAELIAYEVTPTAGESYDIHTNVGRADETVGMTMQDAHLEQVLELLRDTYAVNIVVDYGVVRPNMDELPLYFGDIPPGYASNGWMAYVSMKNVMLEDALEGILRPLGLTYEVTNEAVVISSAERLAQPELMEGALLSPQAICAQLKGYRSALKELQ